MEYTDRQLQQLQKIAFDYALYRTGNIEESQDISSQTISLFLLSFQGKSDARKWIINTTKIYCKRYFASVKDEKKQREESRADLIEILSEETSVESNQELNTAFKESIKNLTDHELRMITFYFQCHKNFKEMRDILDITENSIRVQIHRIKKKLKAETYKRLGFIGTKKIVTPQLNNLIVKFLKRFKKNLEMGTLNRMYYYFSEVDLTFYKNNIHINDIIDYDVDLHDSVYKAWVFYKNDCNNPESFYVEFYVDEKNHLKILTPPTKKKKIVVIKTNSAEGLKLKKLLDKYPEDKTGRPKIPPEELEKIIREFEANQKSGKL